MVDEEQRTRQSELTQTLDAHIPFVLRRACVCVSVSALMCIVCKQCLRLFVRVKLVEGMLIHSDRLEQRLYRGQQPGQQSATRAKHFIIAANK